jgi:FkbM family methyltransferase
MSVILQESKKVLLFLDHGIILKKVIKPYVILKNFMALTFSHIVSFSDTFKFLYFGANKASNDDLMTVTVPSLGERRVFLRKNSTTDREVFKYVFYNQYHLPKVKLPDAPVILDLGTNIGLTVLHYKTLYPQSRIFGFEMDEANHRLALKNCEGLTDCLITNKAIWTATETIQYDMDSEGSDAFSITNHAEILHQPKTVNAITLNDVVKQFNLKRIDFVKMDIEGAEIPILADAHIEWLDVVQNIDVELHANEHIQPTMDFLRNKGFSCVLDTKHWSLVRATRV